MATTYPLPGTGTGNTAGVASTAGLPSSAPVGSQATTGANSYINVGTVSAPIWSQLAGGSNTDVGATSVNPTGGVTTNAQGTNTATGTANASGGTDASTNPITSSAQFGSSDAATQTIVDSILNSGASYDSQISALQQSIAGLSTQQAASILQTGQAAQQQIAAQQTAGDASFQQQIEAAQTAEQQALGNADVTASQANPTGAEQMQTFSPYSPNGSAMGMAANTTYAGMKASISNQFTQTIGNLQASQEAFDQQSAANQSTAAAQTESNAITAAQNSIQNQLTIMQNMESVAQNSQSLVLTAETNSQNFQIQKANLTMQQQYNAQTQATGMMNTILSSLSGTGAEGGWSALSTAQQNQITQLATSSGMPIGAIQAMINQKKATNMSTVTDAFGNATLVGTDASGAVVSQSYIGGGVSPGSQMGNAVASSYGTSYSDIGANFFSTTSAKYSPYMIAAGYKYLSPTQQTQFSGQYAAYSNLNNVATALQNMSQLATSPGDLVSGYPTRSLQDLLQVDPNSTTNPTQFSADLATINSLNPSMYKALTSIQGLAGGIGLSALLNNSSNLLLSPNNTMQTNLQNLENIQSQLETTMNATYGSPLNFPSSQLMSGSGGSNMANSWISGNVGSAANLGGNNSSGGGSTYNGITLPN